MIDQDIKKLGFGLMRLPKKKDNSIDIEETGKMVDLFLSRGFKYFDTAYVYPGSEEAIRKALVERHPRNSFYLTSKLHAGAAKSEEEAKNEIYVSLERTGAGYLDYYLLHALMDDNYQQYEDYHLWDYVKELKEKGLIRHYGFSFHGTPKLLDEILSKHPDVEFVQLQLNYADWEDVNVQSRLNYEIARKHHKPIIVMEPVKGGILANPPKEVQELFRAEEPDRSIPSWAIRWIASKPGVMVVLSGMSNYQQMEDNSSYMEHFEGMSEKEEKIVEKATTLLFKDAIPCTACHYCTEGCPMNIPIPEIFSCYNMVKMGVDPEDAKFYYERRIQGKGKAADCLHCGQCEGMCPQHIEIISKLEEISALFD